MLGLASAASVESVKDHLIQWCMGVYVHAALYGARCMQEHHLRGRPHTCIDSKYRNIYT